MAWHGMAEQPRLAIVDQADPGSELDGRLPADRRGRLPGAVRHAFAGNHLQPSLASFAVVRRHRRHPDLCDPDLRIRLVRDCAHLDRHRTCVALHAGVDDRSRLGRTGDLQPQAPGYRAAEMARSVSQGAAPRAQARRGW
jgi:hypothetical protein